MMVEPFPVWREDGHKDLPPPHSLCSHGIIPALALPILDSSWQYLGGSRGSRRAAHSGWQQRGQFRLLLPWGSH